MFLPLDQVYIVHHLLHCPCLLWHILTPTTSLNSTVTLVPVVICSLVKTPPSKCYTYQFPVFKQQEESIWLSSWISLPVQGWEEASVTDWKSYYPFTLSHHRKPITKSSLPSLRAQPSACLYLVSSIEPDTGGRQISNQGSSSQSGRGGTHL